jgi:hypothetical protein
LGDLRDALGVLLHEFELDLRAFLEGFENEVFHTDGL